MSDREKIERIKEALEEANSYVIQQIYDFLLEEEEWMERPVLNFENMSREQQCGYITESLEELTPDILALICRIVAHAQSGLE